MLVIFDRLLSRLAIFMRFIISIKLQHKMGPGKTTYTFSVTFRFLLRPFSVLPAGGGGWVRRGGGGSGGGNRKYVGVSGKRIR